jgi:hypothetical protein
MTSTPRRKLRLSRETLHNVASQPKAVLATSLSHCAFACQTLDLASE